MADCCSNENSRLASVSAAGTFLFVTLNCGILHVYDSVELCNCSSAPLNYSTECSVYIYCLSSWDVQKLIGVITGSEFDCMTGILHFTSHRQVCFFFCSVSWLQTWHETTSFMYSTGAFFTLSYRTKGGCPWLLAGKDLVDVYLPRGPHDFAPSVPIVVLHENSHRTLFFPSVFRHTYLYTPYYSRPYDSYVWRL